MAAAAAVMLAGAFTEPSRIAESPSAQTANACRAAAIDRVSPTTAGAIGGLLREAAQLAQRDAPRPAAPSVADAGPVAPWTAAGRGADDVARAAGDILDSVETWMRLLAHLRALVSGSDEPPV